MRYETKIFQDSVEAYREVSTPQTTRVTVNYLVGNEENVKAFKATKVVPNADGTLSVHSPNSTVTFNEWVSFEER